MSRELESISSTKTLAEVAIEAHAESQRALEEHEQRLRRAFGPRPYAPHTIGQREVEAATIETAAILGVSISKWKRGKLPTSRGNFPCWYARMPDSDRVLLLYLPSRRHGLCCLVECKGHYHLRDLASLATLGEMLRWSGADCMEERLANEDDQRTVRISMGVRY